MVGAILKQLVGRGRILKDLREAFQKANHEVGGRGLRLVDLMGMPRTTIAPTPGVFICIEALEKCLPKYLPELPRSPARYYSGVSHRKNIPFREAPCLESSFLLPLNLCCHWGHLLVYL